MGRRDRSGDTTTHRVDARGVPTHGSASTRNWRAGKIGAWLQYWSPRTSETTPGRSVQCSVTASSRSILGGRNIALPPAQCRHCRCPGFRVGRGLPVSDQRWTAEAVGRRSAVRCRDRYLARSRRRRTPISGCRQPVGWSGGLLPAGRRLRRCLRTDVACWRRVFQDATPWSPTAGSPYSSTSPAINGTSSVPPELHSGSAMTPTCRH